MSKWLEDLTVREWYRTSFFQHPVSLEDPAGGPDLHAESFAIRIKFAGKEY